MTDASPIVLAIAMLGTIALVVGGARTMRRPAERKRGLLMLVAAAVLLGNVLIVAWPM